MARQTSIDAYHTIEENGLLSRRRWEIYQVLFKHGPLTRSEIDQYARASGYKSHVSARLCELRDLGCVREVRTRECAVTGLVVIEWDVTRELPKKTKEPTRIKCKHCNGKGFFEQERML